MMMRVSGVVAAIGMLAAAGAMAGQPDSTKYPYLANTWQFAQEAKGQLKKAEQAHFKHGKLGGHAIKAAKELGAAMHEIDLAVAFAQKNRKPGDGAAIPNRKLPEQSPDDKKYAELGDARLNTVNAIQNAEDAETFHKPIGTIGGHGIKASEHLNAALKEIVEAEKFADTQKGK